MSRLQILVPETKSLGKLVAADVIPANGLNAMLRIYSKRFAVLVKRLRSSESTFYSDLASENFSSS
jgi:hypothetical protein